MTELDHVGGGRAEEAGEGVVEGARGAAAGEVADSLQADCTVAIGGGSTIGLGKAIALHSKRPVIAVPTTSGTGSEVQVAVAARELLAADGIRARVVSMPCREWFDRQEESYRETVLPPTVKARVSVEAGVAQGWREVVGDHGRIVSIDHYGASADFARIYEEFGITGEAVANAARDSVRSLRD